MKRSSFQGKGTGFCLIPNGTVLFNFQLLKMKKLVCTDKKLLILDAGQLLSIKGGGTPNSSSNIIVTDDLADL